MERKRPAEAVAPLNRIDRDGPWATDADYWKARALYAVGNTRLAVAWLRRVLERRPDDRDALRWLAAAAYDLGDWKTAVASLEHLTRLQPDDAGAWRTLGVIYKEENDFGRARAAYEAALKYAPAQPTARLELAETLVKGGQFADAERQLTLCRGGVPESDRLELLAQCLRAPEDRDGMRKLLDSALATYPDHPGLLAQRAALALVDDQPDEAVALLDRAVAADPFNRQCVYQRALALFRIGKHAEGRRELAHSNRLNELADQLSGLTLRAAESPDDPRIRCRLAALSLDLGDRRQAAYWYRAALGCDPTDQAARAGLGALGARRLPPQGRGAAMPSRMIDP